MSKALWCCVPSPQAPKGPYAALFAAKGIRGCKEVCAVVSQSTRLLRNRLSAGGVPFTMPLHEQQQPAAAPGGDMAASAAKAEEQADGDLCDENPQVSSACQHATNPRMYPNKPTSLYD